MTIPIECLLPIVFVLGFWIGGSSHAAYAREKARRDGTDETTGLKDNLDSVIRRLAFLGERLDDHIRASRRRE
jgi:hypothetical protein